MSFKELEQKLSDSFKTAINFGMMLQAANGHAYNIRCIKGECKLMDVLKTESLHIQNAIAKPDTLIGAHSHGVREYFFVTKGELHIFCQKKKIILEEDAHYYVDAGIAHAVYCPVQSEVFALFFPPDVGNGELYHD
jgi:mannose-6-phosphate isomerase-like protein (cupin superfamily)